MQSSVKGFLVDLLKRYVNNTLLQLRCGVHNAGIDRSNVCLLCGDRRCLPTHCTFFLVIKKMFVCVALGLKIFLTVFGG